MKRFILKVCIVALLFAFILPGCAWGEKIDYSATIERISALIKSRMVENGIVGMSVALVDGQDVVWAEGFGYADKEKGIKAEAETFYEIGSCSKTFTGLAIMTLEEQGLVDLDKPIETYLPGFSIHQRFPNSKPITLRTIMTHHSGIPGDTYYDAFEYKLHPEVYRWTIDHLKDDYTAFPTDFVWAYSNTAITLLGGVIEEVTGQPFLDYGETLLRRIGMKESSWLLHPYFKGRRSKGYYKSNPIPDYYINIAPAGSINSNVLEMSAYIKMINAGGANVVKAKTLSRMFKQQNEGIPLDLDFRMGLTWAVGDPVLSYAGPLCWHTGGSLGCTSRIEILNDHKIGAVAITNAFNGITVANEVVRETLKLALAQKKGITPPPAKEPAFSPVTSWPREKLDTIAGTYVTPAGYDIFRPSQSGGLTWKHWQPRDPSEEPQGAPKAEPLVPRKNGLFSAPDSQVLQIEFARMCGRDVAIIHKNGFRALLGEKYEPVPPSRAWAGRVGPYRIVGLPAGNLNRDMPTDLQYQPLAFTVEQRNDLLIIRMHDSWGRYDLVIEPKTDTLAFIRGLGSCRGESVRVVRIDGCEEIIVRGSHYERVP